MASENLLPFDPNKVPDLIKQGKIRVVGAPTVPSAPEPVVIPSSRAVERAKQLLGEDFLGEEAIHMIEQKFQVAGVNVRFDIPRANLMDPVVEAAKADEAHSRARLIVLRPEAMVVNGERKPLNLINLRELFRKDRRGREFAYDNNPFGNGTIFYKQDWYDGQDFAQESMRAGFGLPTKEVIRDSTSKTWDQQQSLLLPEENRREAVETAWDTLLYYSNTGKKLLTNRWDWGNSLTSLGYRVHVGVFDSNGLHVNDWYPSGSREDVGVCPSR